MNKREAERQTAQLWALEELGFTREEAESLRRISMTLRRWHGRECGTNYGCIERDEITGNAYWLCAVTGRRHSTPDRERGALKRLAKILAARNGRRYVQGTGYYGLRPDEVSTYIQDDPRGAALYILRPGDVPEGGDPDCYYSRGICVY
jgi:hypothetical protein